MGKTDNKSIDTKGTAASGKGDPNTEAASEERKRGRGRPRKSESTTASTEANIPKLVLVEDPNAEEEEAPAAPKNPTKRKRKDVQFEIKKDQLAVLIKTTFDIVGSREGMEIWKLSQKEAELIADPLAGLMAKNPLVDRITSEYGEWIALIVALGTVIVPRAFMMWASKPKKKESVKPYVAIKQVNEKQGTNDNKGHSNREQGGAAGNRDRQPDRQSSNARGNIGAELHGIIPAIQ